MTYCRVTFFLGFCMLVAAIILDNGVLAQTSFISFCFSGAIYELKGGSNYN